MDKTLGKEYPEGDKRTAYLKDNCDKCESKGYMKHYTPEKIQAMKESLSETAIEINDLEEEKKSVVKDFKNKLSPLFKERNKALKGIKEKAEYITEICYKFINVEEKEVGFYNADGDLIDSRPANPDEFQGTIFQIGRATGTEK